MTARIIDGKARAEALRKQIAEAARLLGQKHGLVPGLAVVLVGENPASQVYVRSKARQTVEAGMHSVEHRLPETTSETELLTLVAHLNTDPVIHGILVQLPLPPQIDASRVLLAISPAKDVDCFHPENVGRLVQGRPRFLPCTPLGVQQLLLRNRVEIAGRHVVIVGRSEIVGRPLSIMLSQKGLGGDATVTVCHSRSRDLSAITRQADILIVAIGRPKFVSADMIKPGAVVVDVGINRTAEGLVGDVDYAAAREVAGAISPVPGGVGPLTIAMLLCNTLAAAQALET
jgi:methylenetetrahydrofolate dehydrogenase (NADP+)/methenyltetrahydrofolate cyclohydrolase